MSRILVLGIGNIGVALLKDYARSDEVAEVIAGDVDTENLNRTVDRLGSEKIKPQRVDASDHGTLVDLLKNDFDVVVSTLPAHLNIGVIKAAMEAGVDYADVLSVPYHLHDSAKAAGVTIVPNIGLDPGIDRVLEGYGANKLDKVEKIHMYCGGIPQKDTTVYNNPLKYGITWNWPIVIDSYFGFSDLRGGNPGKTKIIRDGKKVEVDVLSGPGNPEIIRFPEPFGDLEAFYTGAPLDTVENLDLKDITEAWDKTLRWPGHCEIWTKLIDLHLLDREPVNIKGQEIAPRDVLIELGNKYLGYKKGEGDATAMRVEVIGEEKEKKVKHTYDMIDFYDPLTQTTSMGRTTAFPCSIVSQMLARKEIKEKGIFHPSKIGWNKQLAEGFFKELAERNIHVKESTTIIQSI